MTFFCIKKSHLCFHIFFSVPLVSQSNFLHLSLHLKCNQQILSIACKFFVVSGESCIIFFILGWGKGSHLFSHIANIRSIALLFLPPFSFHLFIWWWREPSRKQVSWILYADMASTRRYNRRTQHICIYAFLLEWSLSFQNFSEPSKSNRLWKSLCEQQAFSVFLFQWCTRKNLNACLKNSEK